MNTSVNSPPPKEPNRPPPRPNRPLRRGFWSAAGEPLALGLMALAATAVFTGSPNIQTAAGAATLTASFLLFWAWLNVSMTAVGMSKVPPLGKIFAVPRNLPAHRCTTACGRRGAWCPDRRICDP